MFAHFGNRGIINCQPQEQDGDNNVVLQTTCTQSSQDLSIALQKIKIKPDQVEKIVINLQESSWDNQLASSLTDYLQQLSNLVDININLSNSNIANTQLEQIMNTLSLQKKIERFIIHIHICPQLKYLQQTKTQKFVQIHNGVNQSIGTDFKVLADFLIDNTTLEELNFQSFENSYNEEAHSYLCKGLAKNNHLQKLVLQTITEPPKFWDHLIQNLSTNTSLQTIFIRFLGGCNEKKIASGLYKIYQGVSPVIILANQGQQFIINFRELQVAKREAQSYLTAFTKLIKPLLINNPESIAADLYYD